MTAGLPKILLALLIQIAVLLLIALGVYVAPYWVEPPYSIFVLVMLQAVIAAVLTWRLGLPYWWCWIQFALPVGLYFGVTLKFDPLWALLVFVVVWLFFSNALTERVPLYLTNSVTRRALAKLVAERTGVRFIDLGCGFGGNVVFMSRLAQVDKSCGVETAPLPYLLSKLLTMIRGGKTYATDLWKVDLSRYDVVYAFLSPEPMPRLWLKVQKEMSPGALFVSNSFAVPEIEPTEVWELSDERQTKLYIYEI